MQCHQGLPAHAHLALCTHTTVHERSTQNSPHRNKSLQVPQSTSCHSLIEFEQKCDPLRTLAARASIHTSSPMLLQPTCNTHGTRTHNLCSSMQAKKPASRSRLSACTMTPNSTLAAAYLGHTNLSPTQFTYQNWRPPCPPRGAPLLSPCGQPWGAQCGGQPHPPPMAPWSTLKDWMDAWMEVWMEGWMDGGMSRPQRCTLHGRAPTHASQPKAAHISCLAEMYQAARGYAR
jgi:hypothetical protein